MPIGRDPSIELMPTPAQREEFRKASSASGTPSRSSAVDFWGDAPWVGGCIAGRHYMHITSEGWVEPCIFTHFATDNIKEVGLAEAFNSPFFKQIRSRQPYNDNLLMPCMWIDNPTVLPGDHGVPPAPIPLTTGPTRCSSTFRRSSTPTRRLREILDPAWACLRETMPSRGRIKPRPDEGVTSIAS